MFSKQINTIQVMVYNRQGQIYVGLNRDHTLEIAKQKAFLTH